MPLLPQPVALLPHPTSARSAAFGIDVQLGWAGAAALRLIFRLHGDLQSLALPAPTLPGFADGLWQHTCFEAFVAEAGSTAYREFNFSPSGQWAHYAFASYRQPEPLGRDHPPHLAVRQQSDALWLEASVPLPALPPGHAFDLGLSSVLEHGDGQLSYWALAHPDSRPDFHRREAFILKLSLPDQTP